MSVRSGPILKLVNVELETGRDRAVKLRAYFAEEREGEIVTDVVVFEISSIVLREQALSYEYTEREVTRRLRNINIEPEEEGMVVEKVVHELEKRGSVFFED